MGFSDIPLDSHVMLNEIKRAGVRFIISLPDRVTSNYLLKAITEDPYFRVVQVCKEDEGVSICSGLYATGHRALLLIQNTGLLDSINALRGIAVEGKNPVCLMVGLLNKEPGILPEESRFYGVRIVEPILDAMGIEHCLLESSGDEAIIASAIDNAYTCCAPVAMLIGREPR
jgi:sulfopyruvate decarboxylase subunit alpha